MVWAWTWFAGRLVRDKVVWLALLGALCVVLTPAMVVSWAAQSVTWLGTTVAGAGRGTA